MFKVYTANPISVEEEYDVTKLFTADELLLARENGISDEALVRGNSRGVTVTEMIQLYLLAKNESASTKNGTSFDEMV